MALTDFLRCLIVSWRSSTSFSWATWKFSKDLRSLRSCSEDVLETCSKGHMDTLFKDNHIGFVNTAHVHIDLSIEYNWIIITNYCVLILQTMCQRSASDPTLGCCGGLFRPRLVSGCSLRGTRWPLSESYITGTYCLLHQNYKHDI